MTKRNRKNGCYDRRPGTSVDADTTASKKVIAHRRNIRRWDEAAAIAGVPTNTFIICVCNHAADQILASKQAKLEREDDERSREQRPAGPEETEGHASEPAGD